MAFIGARPQKRRPRQDPAILEAQYARYQRARTGHDVWAKTATEAVRFYEGQQYTPEERALIEGQGRPALTINFIKNVVDTVRGYMTRNRYETQIKPGNNGSGSAEQAEALTMVLKQIDERCRRKWIDSQVFTEGVLSGRGFWDVRLDFSRNALGEVKISGVDPFQVLVDPEATSYDPDEWPYVMQRRMMTLDQIRANFGRRSAEDVHQRRGASPTMGMPTGGADLDVEDDWTSPDATFGLDRWLNEGWDGLASTTALSASGESPIDHVDRNRRRILVLETQHWQTRKCWQAIDQTTGSILRLPFHWGQGQITRLIEWNKARGTDITIEEVEAAVPRWTVTAGDVVLFDDWSPWQRFTLVPYFPYFRRGKTMGMVEPLVDPQVTVNRMRSAQLHILAQSGNPGWIYERGSLDPEMEVALAEQGAVPGINLVYENGKPPPQRIQPGAPPTGWAITGEQAEADLRKISGINESAMGQLDRVQSGRAIEARTRGALNSTEPLFDSLALSRELVARNVLGLVQAFYTEQRIIRVQGDMDREKTIIINEKDPAGRIKNNIAAGSYDVVVDETPATATYLQGQFEDALDLVKLGLPIPPDVLIDLSTMPGKDAIVARMKEQQLAQQASMQWQNLQMQAALGVQPGTPPPPIVATEPLAIDGAQLPPQPPPQAGPPQGQPGMAGHGMAGHGMAGQPPQEAQPGGAAPPGPEALQALPPEVQAALLAQMQGQATPQRPPGPIARPAPPGGQGFLPGAGYPPR